MTKQNQAAETKSDKKRRPKVEPPVVEEQTGDVASLAQLLGGPMAAAGDGTMEGQVARLGDLRLQTAQRQAMATQIGRVQGNRHLQRVVASLKRDGQRETREDRSKSASVVSPNTIQRNDLFEPQIDSVPGYIFAVLNHEFSHRMRVRNARQAPTGTTFRWRWAADDIDTDKLEPSPAVPPEGARATLRAKPKQVFEETTVTPELEVTHPDFRLIRTAPPITISVTEPTVTWVHSISAGGGGEGRERSTERLFVGDTLQIGVWFNEIQDAQTAGIDIALASLSSPPREGVFPVSEVQWDSPTEASLTVEARAAGSRTMWANVFVPGMEEPIVDEFEIVAVNDPAQFKRSLGTAVAVRNRLFSAARRFFVTCSRNYKAGHDAHKAVLDAEGARRQLRQQVMFAVLTGAVGGAVGGLAGVGAISALGRAGVVISSATAKAAAEGAITDVAKNLTIYAITMPGGQSEGGAATEPSVSVGESPGRPEGVAGRGRGEAAAEDPLDWYLGVEEALGAEQEQIDAAIVRMHEAADYVQNFRVDFDFEIDPVELVETHAVLDDDFPLNQLPEPHSAREYEKAFWAAWLSQYAYTVEATPGFGGGEGEGGRTHYRPEVAFDQEMLEAIDRVAREFGETGAQWLREYGGISREREEQAARQLTYPEIYGEYRGPTR